jgi:signal transduction histidine kinase
MDPCSCKLKGPSARSSDRLSEGTKTSPGRSEKSLQSEIQGGNLKLATAHVARRFESERLRLAEGALRDSGDQFQRRMEEYNTILQSLQGHMEQTQKFQDLGAILTPVLAHDLKNHLTAISSLAQFCAERMDPAPLLEKHLRIIFQNSQKANQLIANFLDFARSIKYAKTSAEPMDLHDIIQEIWKVAKLAAVSRHVSWIPRFDKHLPKIMGDSEKMERVFLNLFLNAIQALRKKGKVTVCTRFFACERAVEIVISDTGTGIPKKYHKRIFEPFFTTKKGGTGLGLCTCRAILLQLGGSIRLESIPGQGTKVYIRIPVEMSES